MVSAAFDPDSTWRIACADALEWRSWDEEIILYDERSDETHHFDIATAGVFEALEEKPASVRDLAAVLADKLQVQPDGELVSMVTEIVRILHEKRIIAVAGPGRYAASFH